MSLSRRRFTQEFKLSAVERLQQGASPRPAQPAFFQRLEEILSALRSMTSTHLDRLAVEKLFRVPSAAHDRSWRASRDCGAVTPRRCRGRLSSRVWSRRPRAA